MQFPGIDRSRQRRVKSLILVTAIASLMAAGAAQADAAKIVPRSPQTISQTQSSTGDGYRTVKLAIGPGDTLASILDTAGAGPASKAAALTALGDLFDPMDLRPGAAVLIVLQRLGRETVVRSVHIETGPAEALTVYVAEKTPAPRIKPSSTGRMIVRQVDGAVGPSFHNSMLAANLPLPLVTETLLALENDPGLSVPPPPTARFRVVYEALPRGRRAESDEFRYVEIDDGRKVHRIYRYRLDGTPAAVARLGGGATAAIDFVLPLKRAEVTSPFGWRIHPVFGDRRFHKGVDFRAPKGTPVWASADGVVIEVGWRGNYGKLVRVRHRDNVETTYSHLSGFARGLHAGKQVKQGQVIGYVGRTGVATGHHLYYEMLVDGKHVNPLDPPPILAVRLDSQQLSALKGYLRNIETFN